MTAKYFIYLFFFISKSRYFTVFGLFCELECCSMTYLCTRLGQHNCLCAIVLQPIHSIPFHSIGLMGWEAGKVIITSLD